MYTQAYVVKTVTKLQYNLLNNSNTAFIKLLHSVRLSLWSLETTKLYAMHLFRLAATFIIPNLHKTLHVLKLLPSPKSKQLFDEHLVTRLLRMNTTQFATWKYFLYISNCCKITQ